MGQNNQKGGCISDFRNIIDLLEDAESEWIYAGKMKNDDAQYMIVGGMAVQAHQKAQKSNGGRRDSKDIDIVITPEFRNYFSGFLNQKVADKECPINSYRVENKHGVLYITTDYMENIGIRASMFDGTLEEEGFGKLYERIDLGNAFKMNIVQPEYLIASKISGYSDKRVKDGRDVLSMVNPIVNREKSNKGGWKFSFDKVYTALDSLYPTGSLQSKSLLKKFKDSYEKMSS